MSLPDSPQPSEPSPVSKDASAAEPQPLPELLPPYIIPTSSKKRKRRKKKKYPDRRKLAAVHQLKQSIIVLSIVAVLASILGLFLITHGDFGGLFERQDFFMPLRQTASDEILRFSARLNHAALTHFVPGGIDQFFIAEGDTISRCRIQLEKNELTVSRLWVRNLGAPVTALCLVTGEKPLSGLLLAALGNRIEVINPEQSEGAGTLFAELEPESNIVSLTTDQHSVYAADSSRKQIVRFDMLGTKNLTFGEKNEESGFSGFDFGTGASFSLCYSPINNILYASNPGHFRIEAFDPDTGAWKPEASWEKNPNESGGFYPDENPADLTIFPDGNLVTVESGPSPRIRFFRPDGKLISSLDDPVLDSVENGNPFIAMGPSSRGGGQIYLLLPAGDMILFTLPEKNTSAVR